MGIAQVGAAVSVQLTPEKETPELRNGCCQCTVCTDGCMHLNTLCCAAIAWALSVHLCICMAAYIYEYACMCVCVCELYETGDIQPFIDVMAFNEF